MSVLTIIWLIYKLKSWWKKDVLKKSNWSCLNRHSNITILTRHCLKDRVSIHINTRKTKSSKAGYQNRFEK